MFAVASIVLCVLCHFAVLVEAQGGPSPCGPEPYNACALKMECIESEGWVVTEAEPAGTPCSATYAGPITGTCVVAGHGRYVTATCSGPLPTYAINVTVSGLTGGTLVLLDNGDSQLSIIRDGGYAFAAQVADFSAYNVTVRNPQPAGQICTPRNASGTVNGSNVNVTVTCEPVTPPGDVITYHFDSLRTGWNQNETTLTPTNVKANTGNAHCLRGTRCDLFGLLKAVPLDEQVDAQPLVVRGQTITGQGDHDVVYVATENNSIYAIDASTGTTLLSQLQLGLGTLGPPVPSFYLPGACGNNGFVVGINSTPVIDLATSTLYVITYNVDPQKGPTYYLHALDLAGLTEKSNSPRAISAAAASADGTPISFDAAVQRQRPALLEASGNIYAGFGSFCDQPANQSRGWLLGWNASSLQPLAASQLNDRLDTDPGNYFLSSIWMSGWGPAADGAGNIFFVTGNSDKYENTYGPPNNIQESVVQMSPDLGTIEGIFTPYGPQNLDSGDTDFGSGGVLLLPDQSGQTPHLALAAGKDGNMYLLNRDNLGGLSTTPASSNLGLAKNVDGSIGEANVDGCWCGESYFVGSDGVGRVVSSGGNWKTGASILTVWRIQTSPTASLIQEAQKILPGQSVHDAGFFTTVSSNATSSSIIWAVQRPTTTERHTMLYAFDPTNMTAPILDMAAGSWNSPGANPNIVPVVSNGKVYVASYKQLAIFGVGANGTTQLNPPSAPQPNWRAIYGKIVKVDGALVSIELRSGKVAKIDITRAASRHRSAPVVPGRSIGVLGMFNERTGVIQAQRTISVEDSSASWPADR